MERLFEKPVISINETSELLGVQFPAANRIIAELVNLGWLEEATGQERNRLFSFRPYLNLFS